MGDTPLPHPLVSRRTLLAGSLLGAAGTFVSAAGPAAAASYAEIPLLPGEVLRTAAVTSRTGRSRYEVIDVMVGGDLVRLFVPHAAPPSSTRRQGMVWHFHANGSNHKSLSTVFGYTADQLADDALISICPNFGGTTWTGPRALDLLSAVVAWATGLWNVGPSLLRANSAGGALMTWAYGNRLIPAVIGAYTVNGVYDMEERAQRLPEDTLDDYNGDTALLAASNPARMPGTVWRGTRLRITGTPEDTKVPLASHGHALLASASPHATEATFLRTPTAGADGHGVPSVTNKDMLDTFRRWMKEAVDDTPPPEPALPGAGTYENGSEHIALTGSWATIASRSDSGGGIAHSVTAGASATLTFVGTGVRWVSRMSPTSGINEVVLDGTVAAVIDRYSPAAKYAQTVWSSPALPLGEHTVTIRRTGKKNSASGGTNVILDALVVTDTDVVPPPGDQDGELPSPIARWTLDQAAPPFASDAGDLVLQVGAGAIASGHAAGSNTLSRATVAGRTGLRFGGRNYLQIDSANIGALNVGAGTGQVTVSCWFYNEDSDKGAIAGIWREDANDPARSYCLFYDLAYYNGDERVCGHVSRYGGATPGYRYSKDYSTSLASIDRTGVWEHYAFTYDGQQAVSYLNGRGDYRSTSPFTDPDGKVHDEVKNPYAYAAGLNPAPAEFTVGAVKLTTGMGNVIRGVVSDLRVYDRALTPRQIERLATP